jgi:hypothetical protein
MNVIQSSHLPRSYEDRSTCLRIEVDREMFEVLREHFLPIIEDKSFLGDYNPHIHNEEFGDKYPNHPQFTLDLKNGDDVNIWTQHREY